MRSTFLWLAALASWPLALCDNLDAIAALEGYGIDVSNYEDGAPHAAVAVVGRPSVERPALDPRDTSDFGCKYAVGEHTVALLQDFTDSRDSAQL